MKQDIQNREDIRRWMQAFYAKLLADPLVRHFFDHLLDHLDEHFDHLTDFWDNMLFHTGVYQRNAMMPHLRLHQSLPFQEIHFQQWLGHFKDTTDTLFEGELAEMAKLRAEAIAETMKYRIRLMSEEGWGL